MAVQAEYLANVFPHDSRAIRPELDDASALLGGHRATAAVKQGAVGGSTAFSDITSSKIDAIACFVARKRARVGDVAGAGSIMEGHGALLPPLPAQQAFAPPAPDVQSCRMLCSGASSTSGLPSIAAPASSHGLLSLLYRHGVEVDALVRAENERLRAGLEAARRRHVRVVVSAMDRTAARRLRGAEAELERALGRNAELEEKLRQTSNEWHAWQGVAKSHEAVAAGLRATLDQLLQTPRPGPLGGAGDAEDAQSCCFEQDAGADDATTARGRACKSCGVVDACVLLLPCRHLCLCAGCEAAVDACPVCSANKNGSLHVLLA